MKLEAYVNTTLRFYDNNAQRSAIILRKKVPNSAGSSPDKLSSWLLHMPFPCICYTLSFSLYIWDLVARLNVSTSLSVKN